MLPTNPKQCTSFLHTEKHQGSDASCLSTAIHQGATVHTLTATCTTLHHEPYGLYGTRDVLLKHREARSNGEDQAI